ncbi:hypothetical protein TSAR_013951 [Trichomalopsis sarcophagae]|uniref:Uncharacterized protein n=1 Tax=Trichomalopsis sarcophagae TaxID=543379 RepID=A0A232FB27_9HYME|nr:hypothetical protein TSAR_013951 [Trichomalopsis sarcophagae]
MKVQAPDLATFFIRNGKGNMLSTRRGGGVTTTPSLSKVSQKIRGTLDRQRKRKGVFPKVSRKTRGTLDKQKRGGILAKVSRKVGGTLDRKRESEGALSKVQMAPWRVNNRDLDLDLPLARGWGVKVGFCLPSPWCLDTTNIGYAIQVWSLVVPNSFACSQQLLCEAFVKFLIDHWANDELAPYLGIKTVQLNYEKCYQYTVNDGRINRTIEDNFTCTSHEEADTKIIFHACNIVQKHFDQVFRH